MLLILVGNFFNLFIIFIFPDQIPLYIGSVPFNTSINKFLPERRKKLHKMNFFAKLTGKDLFTGAATPVFAASDPVLEGTGG